MSAIAQTRVLCDVLLWDSKFFGFRIGRFAGDSMDAQQAEAVDTWSRSEGVRCLYFLARPDYPPTIETAERHAFSLVDLRLTLEYKVGQASRLPRAPGDPRPHSTSVIRPARPSDTPVVECLARTVHTDTRFFSDRRFPRDRAQELYATWIRQDCEKHEHRQWHAPRRVFVATDDVDRPVGYLSCHFDCRERTGQIGLVGVSPQARNRGLGKALVRAALDWLGSQQVQQVTVVTQGRNLGAQRLYQQCGFVTRDLRLWYHKWYPSAAEYYATAPSTLETCSAGRFPARPQRLAQHEPAHDA